MSASLIVASHSCRNEVQWLPYRVAPPATSTLVTHLLIFVLYCTVRDWTLLYCHLLYCTALYCTVPSLTLLLHCTGLDLTVLSALYCTLLLGRVLYCTNCNIAPIESHFV